MKTLINTLMAIVIATVIVGCGSKQLVPSKEQVILKSDSAWIHNAEFGIEEDETCAVATGRNFGSFKALDKIARGDLAFMLNDQTQYAKEITETRGGTHSRVRSNYGSYNSITVDNVDVAKYKVYIKNVDTYQDGQMAAIRVCTKGEGRVSLVEKGLEAAAREDRGE